MWETRSEKRRSIKAITVEIIEKQKERKMRRTIAALAMAALFLIFGVFTSARVADEEAQPRDAKSISTWPIQERNGKNVALALEVHPDTPRKLPKGITILVNG